jgi:hypothetical protein
MVRNDSRAEDRDGLGKWQWRSLPLAIKAIAVAALVVLAGGVAYLLITFVSVALGSSGIGESCKPGC